MKNLPLKVIFIILKFINTTLKLGYFPRSWKTAAVIPLLKPGKDPTLPVSYRPISLLPTLSKITEKIILDRLNIHLNTHNIINPEQFGFRPQLSTTHQLLRVTEYITSGFSNKEKTGAIFLDIQKAFDRVWIEGLIYKLILINTPHTIIKLIHSYITNRNFKVKLNNVYSNTQPIRAGVAQGSVLSPTLFAIYVHDIPKTPKIMLAMYADDTAILTKDKNIDRITIRLQHYIPLLEHWLHKWKIALNVEKTVAVLFHNSNKLSRNPNVKIYNQSLTWAPETKYLGVVLDRRLTWNSHITNTIKKFRRMSGMLYPLIARNSQMTTKNRMLVYTAILRPILTYASPVWGYAAKTNFNLLEVTQNRILRTILKAKWYMRNDKLREEANIKTLKNYIKHLATNFFNNLTNINNSEVHNIENYVATIKLKRPRKILID